MLRVYKTYNFNLSNPIINATIVTFSSRPGDLESKDDFYFMNSNLAVLETSINTYNATMYSYLHYDSVPTWLRNQLANRIAQNGSQWAETFALYASGTHNNQWLIADYNIYNQFQNNLSSPNVSNIVWMVEEFYYLLKSEDVTQSLLIPQTYVASYNVPYNQEIYDVSGYSTQYGFNYYDDPRAVLFRYNSFYFNYILQI